MAKEGQFLIGSVSFDADSGELFNAPTTLRLEPRAAAVLAVLCENSGAVVQRQELLDRCWGMGEGSDEALTQAVSQIRRALDELGESGLVETLAKRGYRLRRAASPAAQANAQQGSGAIAWPRWLVSGIVVAAIVAAVLIDPHTVRHSARHLLGLGPTSAAGPTH